VGYSRAGEGGHGPGPEGASHRGRLSRHGRHRRIRDRRGGRYCGRAEGGVGEEAAGAGVPERYGGGHCVAAAAAAAREGEEREMGLGL
jgi:hypothetical protein